MRHVRFLAGLAAFALPLSAQEKPPAKAPAPHPRPAPGVYMTFETSMGSIHCRLYPKDAPIAVRTIAGLATGMRSVTVPLLTLAGIIYVASG